MLEYIVDIFSRLNVLNASIQDSDDNVLTTIGKPTDSK